MVHRTLRFLTEGLLVLAMFLAACAATWVHFLRTPIIPPNHAPVIYFFKPGSSAITLAHDLHAMGLLRHPTYLVLLARLRGMAVHLHAGEYQFDAGETPNQLLNQLVEGRVLFRQFVLVEGWTFAQVMDAININPHLTHTLVGLSPEKIMKRLGYSDRSPEGLFFPDTYRYTAGATDVQLLQAAYQIMARKLGVAWATRSPGLWYKDIYQSLIVASMVEREARLDRERPLIAGVILKRLEKGMSLQIDATLAYLKTPGSALTRSDLKRDGPYNTYTRKGLPPTPISMPGMSSINAAMHPQVTNALFFVAREDGSGGHQFTATVRAHEQAVKQYRARRLIHDN